MGWLGTTKKAFLFAGRSSGKPGKNSVCVLSGRGCRRRQDYLQPPGRPATVTDADAHRCIPADQPHYQWPIAVPCCQGQGSLSVVVLVVDRLRAMAVEPLYKRQVSTNGGQSARYHRQDWCDEHSLLCRSAVAPVPDCRSVLPDITEYCPHCSVWPDLPE